MRVFFLLVVACFLHSLVADELTIDPPLPWQTPCSPSNCPCKPDLLPCPPEDIVVDLIDPLYSQGVLSTDKGGVLEAPGIRIQARSIRYTRIKEEPTPVWTVFCEGDLLIEYNQRILVGERFYYDFQTETGLLTNGKAAYPPWFLSGECIELCANGNIVVKNGAVTTSEGGENDVVIATSTVTLTPEKVLSCRDVVFRIRDVPFFWLPYLSLNLNESYESPVAFRFAWGGFPGTQLGVRYPFLRWRDLKAFARFDVFLGQGYGGGIETAYCSSYRPLEIFTRNYFARDIAIYDPQRKNRYRFQGTYYDAYNDGRTTLKAVYDVVSDAEMAADYNTNDFELKTADRTEFLLCHQASFSITRLLARVRVNDFQSVNQELPTLFWSMHPLEIADTGIIAETFFKASYLDYEFSQEVKDDNPVTSDFQAGRFEARPRFYKPFYFGPVTLTPEAAFVGIAYSNSPSHQPVGQAVGDLSLAAMTSFYKRYGCLKHVVEPYLCYHYLTSPRVGLDRTFIFTINDGFTG